MRVIARTERPHPGAQLRITDPEGLRVTAFATNSTRGQLPDLELRHRRRARAEDRIRCAKDTELSNLPLHTLAQNHIWCAVVTLAAEITAWMQLLALSGTQAPVGTQEAAAAVVHHRRHPHPTRTHSRADAQSRNTPGPPSPTTPSPRCDWPPPRADASTPTRPRQHEDPRALDPTPTRGDTGRTDTPPCHHQRPRTTPSPANCPSASQPVNDP